jgi:hypothetical protein
MFTDVKIINQSLNTNVRSIGVFWDTLNRDQPVIYRQVRNLGFLWEHPFRIDWALSVLVLYRDGNQYGPVAPESGDARVEVKSVASGLSVAFRDRRRVTWVALCLGGTPISIARPDPSGPTILSRPVALTFCADLPLRPGSPVVPAMLNVGQTTIDPAGLRTLDVTMAGGEPGPRSKAIRFVVTRARR